MEPLGTNNGRRSKTSVETWRDQASSHFLALALVALSLSWNAFARSGGTLLVLAADGLDEEAGVEAEHEEPERLGHGPALENDEDDDKDVHDD